MNVLLLIPIALPALAGILLLASSFREHLMPRQPATEYLTQADLGEDKRISKLHICAGTTLAVSVLFTLFCVLTGEKTLTLFTLLDAIPIYFHMDSAGAFFVAIVGLVWLAAGVYAFSYMRHEGEEKRFFGFYLLLYGVLVGLGFSGNLITMYLFYELMTLVSAPLVLHNGTREAIMATLKYLFYSMCGAYGGLFGILFLNRYCTSLDFTAGGALDPAAVQGHEGLVLTAVFVMILGFGVKAGMLPFHAWLPTAHPAAPSPASAVLSAIIVKSGVLALVRTVYYIVGPKFLRGTWVQYAWMTLTLVTVFMGSMLAYREKVFKKRLAYSTVSQVSYILFGLSMLNQTAMAGALLHTAAHALIKCGLFLTAGVFLYSFGCTRVEQLTGMGKKMPVTMWCYTFFALALVGIPPTNGFISKWYLAEGALESGIAVFSWLGPAVLLISALLTAGYLLPITMKAFFPGEEAAVLDLTRKEPSPCMLLPLIILAALVLLLGIFPNPLTRYVTEIVSSVLK